MCGIFGFNFKDESLAKEMVGVLKHRGPDGDGVFFDEFITLGHTRLSIIDLSDAGRQPMTNVDKSIFLSFNGEIYNFKELRSELQKKGKVFTNQTDTEVVLRGYEVWGEKVFEKLRGMWALALYDKYKNKIILSKDFFGIKPLYYYFENNVLIFSSEISAIKTFWDKKNIKTSFSDFGISSYFVLGYALSPFTVFENIKKIKPGEILIFDVLKKEITSSNISWDFKGGELGGGVNPAKLADFEQVMKESVERHLLADVPVGVFLSGGSDSTLIALILKKLGVNISAFTVRIKEKKDADFAKKIAEFAKLSQEEVVLNEQNFGELYDEVFLKLDEPIADTSLIPSLLVAKEASKKVKVVLTGEGADELFLGYERHRNLLGLSKIGNFFPNFFKFPERDFYLQYLKPIFRRVRLLYFYTKKDLLGAYLENASIDSDFGDKKNVYKYFSERARKERNCDESFFDQKFYLPDNLLKKTDFATMSHSIEGRVPFLDKEVYQFSKNLDKKYKLQNGSPPDGGKKIIKDYLASNIPPELIFRKKEGFSLDPRIYIFKNREQEIKEAIKFMLDLDIVSVSQKALFRALNDSVYLKFILNKFPQTAFSWLAFYKTLNKYKF